MTDTRPSWAGTIGQVVIIPAGHGFFTYPLNIDAGVDEDA